MKKILTLTTLLFISLHTHAQTPTLLKNIAQGNASSDFGQNGTEQSGVIVNNVLFSIINGGLWKSDGSEVGTTELINRFQINQIFGIGKAGSTAYFTEYSSSSNVKLWKSDGTVTGTVSITNVAGTIFDSAEMNGILYFVCRNTNSIYELWRSDGTVTGTYLLKNTNLSNWVFNILKVVDNTLYFVSNTSSTGNELWKTDGTVANTQIVKDIYVGSESSFPNNFININGILFFSAQNNPYDYELWRSDGTDIGTYLVKDTGVFGSSPSNFQKLGNKLIYTATNATTGRELWVSDGTDANSYMLKDIFPGNESGCVQYYIEQLSNINDYVLFLGNDGVNGISLWRTDGTTDGTVMVKDLIPGNNNDIMYFNLLHKYKTQNNIYLSVTNNFNIDELWQSDGTTAGTFIVNSLNPNLEFYLKNSPLMAQNSSGNNFYFTAYDKEAGIELWKTDGTPSGLLRVKDISTGGDLSSDIRILNSINGYTFFSANNIINGTELWRTDGTTANTELFRDFTIGRYNSGNTIFGFSTIFNNQLYIQTDIGKIWRTDGIQFSLFKSFPVSGNQSSYPSIVIGNNLFFVNLDYINGDHTGLELFKTDGITTSLVKNINPAKYADSYPGKFCNVNGTLFFTANDGINGRELWKSDGTDSGTVLVKNISSGLNSTDFNQLTTSNGLLFFMTDNYTKIWRSDGTDSGTFQVYNAGSNYMGPMIGFNNKIFFRGFESESDGELWESDGTLTGTKITKNINPTNGSYPGEFVEMDGAIYFNASNQFWKSDGTANGTVLLSPDISPYNLYNANGTMYFSALWNPKGIELWESDGTTTGTSLVTDLNPESGNSNPNSFHLSDNGKFYFLAQNNTIGSELFVRSACTPNFNLSTNDNYPNGTNIKKEAKTFISAVNKVENGANVKYDAGKYIVLNAGFEAKEGSNFKAYIDGCTTDESNSTIANLSNFNTNNAVDLTKNYPTFYDFLNLPQNTTLRVAYLTAQREKELFEKNKMLTQGKPTEKPISEPAPISYYITETGQKEAIADYKLVLKIGDKEYSSTLQKKL